METKIQHILERIKEQEKSVSKANEAQVVEVLHYNGMVDHYTTHVYRFSVKEPGELTTQMNHIGVFATLYDKDFNKHSLWGYLPVGEYTLVVTKNFTEPDEELDYEVNISGALFTAFSTDEPTLDVTGFPSHNPRLSRMNPEIALEGTTDADQVFVEQNHTDIIDLTSPTFRKWVSVEPAVNRFDFYASSSASKNWVVATYFPVWPGVERLDGKDRYEVSTRVSWELKRYLGERLDTIVLARGDVFSDALSASSLHWHLDYPYVAEHPYLGTHPVLLTTPSALPESVKTHIKILAPRKAIILGGTDSVSTHIVFQLKKLGVSEVVRLDGKDRFEVSAKAALQSLSGAGSATAYVTNGLIYSDALSASGYAGAGKPLLLVQKDRIPETVANVVKNRVINEFVIVGGPSSVSDGVIAQIKKLNPSASVLRIGGANRFEVSTNMAKYHFNNKKISNIKLARGDVFADALTSSSLAGYEHGPILLTMPSKLDISVKNFISSHWYELDYVHILGGTDSVSSEIEHFIDGLIRD
ncbi:cell wall-binding repeat-containing protein [Laceyella putida]|uniref:Cell wall-binding repeat-containing protein n=1 Tax=Laceyella putida TaxID=110101 RepID=A0ABW2RP69_9BACL